MEVQDIPYQAERVIPPIQDVEKRRRMVVEQIAARDIRDPAVLKAMENVPREAFVPTALRDMAYQDNPLPIGHGQTISQPYIVALMAEAAQIKPKDRVLEVGTGSGYGAAVLGQLSSHVDSVEVDPDLATQARTALKATGADHINVWTADGKKGLPSRGPFDAIIVTAAGSHVPTPLLEQLRTGGRLVMPVEENGIQQLVRLTKTPGGFVREPLTPVHFVPLQ